MKLIETIKNTEKLPLLAVVAIALLFTTYEKQIGGDIIDAGIDIFLENSSGENLLIGNTANSIDLNTVKLHYKVEDSATEFFNGIMDCPRNVC